MTEADVRAHPTTRMARRDPKTSETWCLVELLEAVDGLVTKVRLESEEDKIWESEGC